VTKLKSAIQTVKKGELFYIVKNGGRVKKFRPWLGDSFAFLYDFIMRNSVFPKKFGGDIETHYSILTQELGGVRNQQILELGAGSGSAVHFLRNENHYVGTDISSGLLKQAAKRFHCSASDGMGIDEETQWVKEKLERSWNKLRPQVQKMMKEKYEAALVTLTVLQ